MKVIDIYTLSGIIFGLIAMVFFYSQKSLINSRIEIEPNQAAFLSIPKPGETEEGRFIVRNSGGKALKFHVKASCGCTMIDPIEATLEPGGSTTVRYQIRLSTIGESKTVTFTLHSNDFKNPQLTRFVHGTVPSPFEFEPQSIQFSKLPIARRAEVKIRVKVIRGTASSLQARSDHGSIKVQRTTIDPPFVEFLVSVVPDKSEHSIFGRIIFQNSFGVEDFVHVRAEMFEPVSIVPSLVTIKRSSEKTNRKDGIFLVYRSDGSPLGKVEMIDPSCPFSIVSIGGSIDRRKYRVVLNEGHEITGIRKCKLKVEGFDSPLELTLSIK